MGYLLEVRWSLVTLPTFWSLVTLPTSLGRVASDPLVFFLWPCSLKNTSHRILLLVVACDPTYLFGRVASDHFLALAIPKHLPWPDLHSDLYDPTVQLVTVSMGFVWQAQQFRCLWDVLPWPYTCWLGSVKWLLCGRRNNFDASEMISPDPIHACWEGSQVIDSDFVWPAQYFQCLREVLCDPMFGDTGDPTCFLCGRCRILDGSEKFLVYTFCLCGRCNILETSEKVTVTLVPFCGRFLPCLRAVLRDPIRSLCVAGAIFFDASEHFLRDLDPRVACDPTFVWQVQIIGDNGDPTFFLCGRCNIFDASGKFLVTLFLFCVAGALVTRPPRSTLWPHVLFVWQVLYVRCLREVLVTWTRGSLVTPRSFLCGRPPRSSADTAKGWLWPYVLFAWHVQ